MDPAGKKRGLGRGLGALIPGADETERLTEPSTAAISSIQTNPFQPRHRFQEDRVDELARSIREKGILQPLLVRRRGESYELIAGERRLRAAQRAGMDTVPITVRDVADEEMLELALIENIQREDLTPIEEARAYKTLIDELHITQQDLSDRIGRDRSTIANSIRLLQLPDGIQADIESGAISAGHARALAMAQSDSARLDLAKRVVRERLSVRQTERIARQHRRESPPEDADVIEIERRLTEVLGTRVRVQGKTKEQGKIEIEYYSLEQLNGLIARLLGRDL